MGIRETVESVYVAIVLAFVLRAFMVEAFVIPTGSMAPRLMGEHYDLQCPACGHEYSYGWHDPRQIAPARGDTYNPDGAHCPSCGFAYPHSRMKSYVNGGDRVLVMKYLYRFIEPKPWDVIVFRNPQSNDNNYIKRLIGLPGETIEIVHGDVFVIPHGKRQWQVRRKPDRAQEAMWQVVFDSDYVPDMTRLAGDGIKKPRRWEPLSADGPGLWDAARAGERVLAFSGGDRPEYLAFKGLLRPSLPEAEEQSRREAFVPRYSYNSARQEKHLEDVDLCGDLKLSGVFRPLSEDASVSLIVGGLRYAVKARFDADGTVAMFRRPREVTGANWPSQPWRQVSVGRLKVGGGYQIALAHVDCGAKVWVGRRKVIDEIYPGDYKGLKQRLAEADESPIPAPMARIGAVGGPLELWHVRLMRDVYYTSFTLSRQNPPGPPASLKHRDLQVESMRKAKSLKFDIVEGAPGWGVSGRPIKLAGDPENPSDMDEFFVLGDNSPQSLDSRGWIEAAPSLRLRDGDKLLYHLGTVPRYNLIGKAMFVYWPSGFRLPLLPGLPIVPDVGRMRLIR